MSGSKVDFFGPGSDHEHSIKAVKPRRHNAARAKLTAYESEQVEQIGRLEIESAGPDRRDRQEDHGADGTLVEKIVPKHPVRAGIERAYELSPRLAGRRHQATGRRDRSGRAAEQAAGRVRPARLPGEPVREWPGLAEGLATGAGGFLTTLIDVPLLFVLTLRTIIRIGHCYGYALDHRRDQAFVLGVYLTATSGTLHTKRRRLEELRELEELLISETQREVLAEELLSFLFQLEIFEAIPGLGAISGGLLNVGVMRRVERTTRRVFQERWLRDNGKVQAIAPPAPAQENADGRGWSGVLIRAAYSGCYGLGFAAVLPASILRRSFARWTMP